MHQRLSTIFLVALASVCCSLFSACASDPESEGVSRLSIPEPGAEQSITERGEDGGAARVVPVGKEEAVATPAAPSASVAVPMSPVAEVVAAPVVEPVTVYTTRTGSKYHTGSCRYLSKSKIPIPLDQARKSLAPCSVCKPPR